MSVCLEMKKILIIKIGAIGDVIMSLPLLQALKHDSEVQITWICGKTVEPLLKKTELIDELISVNEESLFNKGYLSSFLELFSIWKKIGFRFFDRIIILYSDPRYRVISFFSFGKKLFFGKNRKKIPGRYHAEEYLSLGLNLDGPTIPKAIYPSMPVSLEEKFIPIFKSKIPLIALAPGGAKNLLSEISQKRWPIDYYVSLAKQLLQSGYRVAITGSSTDNWVLEHFKNLEVINLVGQTSLLDLISIYKNCSLLITHDSSPLHLAKLAKCPTIALFGPTNPSEFIGEKNHPNIFVFWEGKTLACCPCYDGKKFSVCSKNLCLENISPEVVFKQATWMLDT